MADNFHSIIDSSDVGGSSRVSKITGDRLAVPGIVPLRSMVKEETVCKSAMPDATGSEIRVSSSLCVDHLCGCKAI